MSEQELWELARAQAPTLRVSTIFMARDFERALATDAGVQTAIAWCKVHGVTRVFLETFRNGYEAPRAPVVCARDAFRAAGISADGGVTTTHLGKKSSGWNIVCCYNDPATVANLQHQFEYAASLFDLVMIDDFWFTDCDCAACTAARGTRSWSDYRRELMTTLSRERILGPARRVNPKVEIIIKYPQWYDRYHLRGYDIVQETRDFDWIWAGTELRDPQHTDPGLPHVQQYEGFFVMRYLGLVGGAKCLGGWFDDIATSPVTYVEQAWQTVLGGAAEMMLFAHAALVKPNGMRCLAALRVELPRLFELAALVRARPLVRGVVMPKPPQSEPGDGRYFYDFAGMLGLPVLPSLQLTADARAAFLSAENLHDPGLAATIRAVLQRGGHVAATDGLLQGLAARGEDAAALEAAGVRCVEVRGDPARLLDLPAEELAALRAHLLAPVGLEVEAPVRVAVTVLGDDMVAVSNHRDEPAPVRVRVAGRTGRVVLQISERKDAVRVEGDAVVVPARTLAVLKL